MYFLYRDPNEEDVMACEHNKGHCSSLEEQAKKLQFELMALKAQEQVKRKQLHPNVVLEDDKNF